MTSERRGFSSPQPRESGRDCLSPDSKYASPGIASLGDAIPVLTTGARRTSARRGRSWMTMEGRGSAPLGKKVFPGKDEKACWAEGDTRCPWQTAREYIILSTNVHPIKGPFHFPTWYQINFNSDNYPSRRTDTHLHKQ